MAYFTHGLWQHSEVDDQLEHALHEVDQSSPGWRLADLEAVRATVPANENSALDVDRAAPHLPMDLYSWNARRLLYFYSRGPEALDLEEKLAVRAELDYYKESLDEAQALADKPHGTSRLGPGRPAVDLGDDSG